MADPIPTDDLADLARDEEALFARDFDGRLIRVDAPSLADLGKVVKVRVDGSEWFEVPKAVPATDAQGNIIRNPDDTPVVRATTIYDATRTDAALAAGLSPPVGCPVRIPVLCHRDHLPPVAVCRVCAVQIVKPDPRKPDDPKAKRIERKLFPACQHRVEAGMEVHTMWSPEANYRKAVRSSVQVLFELLAADHYHPAEDAEHRNRGRIYHNELAGASRGEDALDSTPAADLQAVLRANWMAFYRDAVTDAEKAERDRVLTATSRFTPKLYRPDLVDGWVEDLPLGGDRRRLGTRELAQITSAPPFVVDHNNCILCDRCIRACSDVKPFKVIGRSGKGSTTRIAFDLVNEPMASSSCRACGECMTACPTGAITFQYRVLDACPERLADQLTGHSRLSPAGVVEADELLEHPLFARMSKAFLEWNRGAVRRRKVRPGDVLAEEGEFGTTAFILPEGLIAICRRGGKTPRDLPYGKEPDVAEVLARIPRRYGPPIWVHDPDPADVIGEMSPMSHARRNASLIAVRPGTVMEIDRNILHLLLRDPINRLNLDRRYALRAVVEFLPQGVTRSELFAGVTEEGWVRRFVNHLTRAVGRPAVDRTWWDMVLDSRLKSSASMSVINLDLSPTPSHRSLSFSLPSIAMAAPTRGEFEVELVQVEPGQLICRAGEPADNFYLIRRGFVRVEVETPTGPTDRPPLGAGDCFGEVAVLTGLWDGVERAVGRPVARGIRSATCTALDNAELVMIPKSVFESFLNDRANESVRKAMQDRCVEILSRDVR